MSRRLLAALTLVACLGVPSRAHAASWTKLQSDHFTLIGDASEHDIRQIAQKLEQFRDVLHRAIAGSPAASPVPTVVFVFSNENVMAPFRPAYQGKPVEAAGYFIGADEANYIVLSAEQVQPALQVVFHELTHAMTENTVGALPTWLNEGLATFYETAEEGAGRSLTVGKFPDGFIPLARPMTMPLDEVLTVNGGSRVYNESGGNRRNVFYAESWALTHYLMLGNPTRRDQLADYLQRLQQGAPAADAFRLAFQTDTKTIEKELRDYVSRTNFPVARLTTDPDIGKAATAHGERITEREARANLGDLLAHVAGREADARAYLAKVLQEDPNLPRALASVGTMDLRNRKTSDGLALLARAAAAAPDDGRIQGEYGTALVAELGAQPDADDFDRTLAEARRVLARAVELQPGAANSLSNDGYVLMVRDGDLAGARSMLTRAINAAPARERYRLLLAEVLLHQREFDQATTVLGPLVARGDTPATRDRARRLLAQLADTRNRPAAASSASAASTPSPAAGAAAIPPPPNPASDSTNVAPPTGAPRFIPTLRPMGTGEVRALGTFRSIECTDGTLTLVLETNEGPLRLGAAKFADIQFLTYRPEPPAAVNCGAVQGAPRVLATYRPATGTAGVNGQAVAIELLPDGYVPR